MTLIHFRTQPAHPRTPWDTLHLTAVHVLPRMLRLLGVKENDVQDLSQEILFAAYRSLDRFNPSHFHADPADAPGELRFERTAEARWLYGIAWRQVNHYLNRAYRRRERPAGLLTEARSQAVDPAPSAEEDVAAQERMELTVRLLDSVAPERRVILVLNGACGIPIAEIAQVLEINVNTAFSRLRLARADYRAAVKRLGAKDRRTFRSGVLLVPPIPAVFFADEGAGESDAEGAAPQSAPEVEPRGDQGTAGAPRRFRGALIGLGRGLWPIAASLGAAAALILALETRPIPWARHFGMSALQVARAQVAPPAKAAAGADTNAVMGADAHAAVDANAATGATTSTDAGGRHAPASSSRAGSVHGRDFFEEERRELAAVQQVVARGDFAAALEELAVQERRFSQGRLRLVREQIRASLLAAQSGRTEPSPYRNSR